MEYASHDFVGVKIALIYGESLVMILRDDTPGLRLAGLWDFPGGGRENGESPFACAAREVKEELSLTITQSMVRWSRTYPAMVEAGRTAYFLAGDITRHDVDSIVLGDEGQEWRLVRIDDFFARDDVVPQLKGRLQDYLARA
jgi:8-oxo-dGTP diphosphatase